MNIAIFWDIALCNLSENRDFGGKYHHHLQGRKSADQEEMAKHLLHTGFLLG
jgi:hypothetical protein